MGKLTKLYGTAFSSLLCGAVVNGMVNMVLNNILRDKLNSSDVIFNTSYDSNWIKNVKKTYHKSHALNLVGGICGVATTTGVFMTLNKDEVESDKFLNLDSDKKLDSCDEKE